MAEIPASVTASLLRTDERVPNVSTAISICLNQTQPAARAVTVTHWGHWEGVRSAIKRRGSALARETWRVEIVPRVLPGTMAWGRERETQAVWHAMLNVVSAQEQVHKVAWNVPTI
jgi:hypothetical protein